MSFRFLSVFAACLLCSLVMSCEPDDGTGDRWEGAAEELVGSWRDRNLRPEGREFLLFDLSGVYRVVLDAPTAALETERGSYSVEDGFLVRVPTRHIDPSQIGRRVENGIYSATDQEIVLEPASTGASQIVYERTTSVPTFTELH